MHYMLHLVLIKIQDILLSIIVEHGGSGSSAAAPMATKLFKLILIDINYRKQLSDLQRV